MGDQRVIIPGSSEEFVALSSTGTRKRFKKHILSKGPLHYPTVAGGTLYIDDEFMDTLVDNFKNGVCPIVQTPLVDDKNRHSEAPERNIGTVVDLSVENDKLYATIEAVRHAEDLGETILGASAMLSTNYTDTRNKSKVGPALLHVALTNRPHIVDLEGFEEIIAASGDSTDEAVLLTASIKENTMDLEEFIEKLKAEHNIDVHELQEKAKATEEAEAKAEEAEAKAEESNVKSEETQRKLVSLSNDLSEALGIDTVISLSGDETLELSSVDSAQENIVGAITELKTKNIELSGQLQEIEEAKVKADAENRVDSLVKDGYILPAKRDAQLSLLLSNSELFEELLPEDAIVRLSHEDGSDPADADAEAAAAAEVERLAELANRNH